MKASRRNIFESVMEEQQHHGLAERRVAAQAEVLASVYDAHGNASWLTCHSRRAHPGARWINPQTVRPERRGGAPTLDSYNSSSQHLAG